MSNPQVSVYIEPALRRAFRQLTVDTDRTFSDLVCAAMAEYLVRHHPDLTMVREPAKPDPSAKTDVATDEPAIIEVLGDLTRAVEEIRRELGKIAVPAIGAPAEMPLAPMVADAAKHALALLEEVGPTGIKGTEFQARMASEGYPGGPLKAATAALQRAGVIVRTRNGWFLAKHAGGDK